jgi:cytochrome c oxidase assembly protein subunit 15
MQNLIRLTGWTMILTYMVIVIGAAVRVYDAGLSCPDWPKCYGLYIPFPVEESWGYSNFEVFLEWVHRLLAAVLGFLILAITVLSFKHRNVHKGVFLWPLAALILLFLQVKLGMITVLLSNIHWTVAIHLGNAMILFAMLVIARKRMATLEDTENKVIPVSRKFKINLWILLFITFFTMLLGAMVSTSHSGGICGGLPLCHGEFMPKGDFQAIIHMKHRLFALFTVLIALTLFMTSYTQDITYKNTAKGVNILIGLQVVIGTVLLYSFSHYAWAYKGLSVFHLAWGTIILLAIVGALCKVYFGKGGSFHK